MQKVLNTIFLIIESKFFIDKVGLLDYWYLHFIFLQDSEGRIFPKLSHEGGSIESLGFILSSVSSDQQPIIFSLWKGGGVKRESKSVKTFAPLTRVLKRMTEYLVLN